MKFNNRVKKELKMDLFFHHAQSVSKHGTSAKNTAFLVGLSVGVNRIIHALIFICFGAISSFFFGSLSIVAYVIAIAYLYLALRAMYVDFGPAQSDEYHQTEMVRLRDELVPHSQPSSKPEA